jgi:hypothetical protein
MQRLDCAAYKTQYAYNNLFQYWYIHPMFIENHDPTVPTAPYALWRTSRIVCGSVINTQILARCRVRRKKENNA